MTRDLVAEFEIAVGDALFKPADPAVLARLTAARDALLVGLSLSPLTADTLTPHQRWRVIAQLADGGMVLVNVRGVDVGHGPPELRPLDETRPGVAWSTQDITIQLSPDIPVTVEPGCEAVDMRDGAPPPPSIN